MKTINLLATTVVVMFLLSWQNANAQNKIEIINMAGKIAAKEIKLDDATEEFVYNYKYNTDTASVESNYTEMKMLLIRGNEVSRFYSLDRAVLDSMIAANPEIIKNNFGQYKTGTTVNIFKDYKSSIITYTDKIGMDYYRYTEQFPEMEWKIGSQTKEILGYTCTIAEMEYRGRKWIAWFAPDIPIMDGPWKFRGLPGLIMEIADSRGHYSWQITGIKNVSAAGKKVTVSDFQYIDAGRKDFYKTFYKYMLNPFGFVTANNPEVKITVTNADGSPYVFKEEPMKYGFIECDIIKLKR